MGKKSNKFSINSELNDLDRINAKDLSYEEFVQNFRKKRTPVLITGAFDQWACSGFNLDNLTEVYGHKKINYRHTTGKKSGIFSELLQGVKNSSFENPFDYLRNIHIKNEIPELFENISECNISYALPNWKDSIFFPEKWLGMPKYLIELFVGGIGMEFPTLHIDYWGMDGLISQVYGEKDFLLIPPSESHLLYPNALNPLISDIDRPFDFEYTKFPMFQNAKKLLIVLKAGETLFNPGWWHTTQMKSECITIIQSLWHEDNWKDLYLEIERTQKNKLKNYLYQKYLFLYWLLNKNNQ